MMKYIGLVLLVLCLCDVQAANINMGPNGCTLKDAIRSANADAARGNCAAGSGTDIIIAPDEWSIVLNSDLPDINSNLTIQSMTDQGTFYISGDQSRRIFNVLGNDTEFTLRRVSLADAKSNLFNGPGGAILINDATVNLVDVSIGGSRVVDTNGTAIALFNAELNIENSVIRNNVFESATIGLPTKPSTIYALDSSVQVNNSLFQFNNGFSIRSDQGELTIENSLFEEPNGITVIPALDGINGWGVNANNAILKLHNSTFANQYRATNGGVTVTEFSDAELTHLTFFRSQFRYFDSVVSATNSFFFTCDGQDSVIALDAGNLRNGSFAPIPTRGSDCPGDSTGDYMEQPLTDNGGPTKTLGIPLYSDMVNGGADTHCLPVDQRGETRVLPCDVGAFELNDVSDIALELELSAAPPYVSGQRLLLEITVTNNGPGTASDLLLDMDLEQVFIQSIDSGSCAAFPCAINQLNAGDQRLIAVMVTLGNAFNQAFEIDASVLSTATSIHEDPDQSDPMGNNYQIIGFPINAGADLGIVMELLTPPPYAIDQVLDYRATITNHGNDLAQNIDFSFSSSGLSLSQFIGCDAVNNSTCQLNALLNGGSVVIDVEAKINSSPFNAVGFVDALLTDVNPSNDVDDLLNGGAVTATDVAVEIEVLDTPGFYSYEYIAYEVTVSTFAQAAIGLELTYYFPGSEVFGTGGCFLNPCQLPDMGANSSQTFRFDTFAPVYQNNVLTEINNSVVISSSQADTNLSNNSAAFIQGLSQAADVGVQVNLVTSGPYHNQQIVTYEVAVANNGSNHATDVMVDESLLNLSLLWIGHESCEQLSCVLAQLDRFQTENFEMYYQIDDVGAFELSVSVSANEFDETMANNQDDAGDQAQFLDNDPLFSDDFE